MIKDHFVHSLTLADSLTLYYVVPAFVLLESKNAMMSVRLKFLKDWLSLYLENLSRTSLASPVVI
jgi:hypothetical protein